MSEETMVTSHTKEYQRLHRLKRQITKNPSTAYKYIDEYNKLNKKIESRLQGNSIKIAVYRRGVFIGEFDSVQSAAIALDYCNSSIHYAIKACQKSQKYSYYGYRFEKVSKYNYCHSDGG